MNSPELPDILSTTTAEIMLGRQPIMDSSKNIKAYELLFRSEADTSTGDVDDLHATSTVIINTLSQFGLDYVLGNHDAFINVSASFLLSETVELLPADRIVLEILEDVPINSQILSRCQALKNKGFRLALDGFTYHAQYDPLLPLIDYVKIDLKETPLQEIPKLLAPVKKLSKAILVAEKVEEESAVISCKQLGFSLFQGHFFAKPTILQGKKPQPHQLTLMRILGMLIGDADIDQLEKTFKDNPALTISLLRLVNSVGINGGRQEISSLRQAIVVLGRKQLLRWVQLLLYAYPGSTTGNGLMLRVANRAKLMELMALRLQSAQPNIGDQAYMVGMLSLADVVLQAPLENILEEIGLASDLKEAILSHDGLLGKLLSLAELIENEDFVEARKDIQALGITAADFIGIQLQAMRWTNELEQQPS